jgi:purine-binding chemotaxis protein CheW
MTAMNTITPTTPSNHLPSSGKYLNFSLANERYSISVLKVREIMRLCPITAVPRMPSYIKGVINLRGKIVPVIDLRERFGLPPADELDRICIIVVQFNTPEGGLQLMGMIVDIVDEVSHFSEEDLEAAPDFGSAIDTRFIIGMAKNKGAVKTLLDIDRLLNFVGAIDLQAMNTVPSEVEN